jgi:hypothetical protein
VSEAGSGIEGFRHGSKFAEYVASRLKQETFKLVDVGCAGGLARGWRAFGDKLNAIGFDTNAEEVARLSAAEANPSVRYQAGWVGMPDDHPLKQRIGTKAYWHQWPAGRLAYERTYDLRSARQNKQPPLSIDDYIRDKVLGQDWLTTPSQGFDLDYVRPFEVFLPSAAESSRALAAAGPDSTIHLPAYLKAAGFYDADFLKLDIDGPDYEVLRSITDLLTQPSLIGVSLEVCFYGSHDANDNSFHNMDRLMREKGFDLLGLSVRTYAAAALPFPYLDAHPSMNAGGRPFQGDALYVRDLGSRVRAAEAAGLSDEKLAKAAALIALFNLPDHAAEILQAHRSRLQGLLDVDHGLDLLAAEIQAEDPIAENYRAYMAAFEAEAPRFFDRYAARNAWMSHILQGAGRADAEAAQAREAQRQLDEARRDMENAARRVEADAQRRVAELKVAANALQQSQDRLAALEQSTSWRLTAPLRALAGVFRNQRR